MDTGLQRSATELPDTRPGGSMAKSTGMRWRDIALIAYGRAFEHPSKIRIVRWLVRRLVGGRIHVRYARNAVIAIDPADYIGWAILTTGHYESASLSLALRIMAAEPGLFVDVGANFGWYSCAVAAAAGGQVISIEPDCENCTLLRANIRLGKLQDIVVFNGAVGSNFEAVQMIRRAPTNSGTVAVRSSGEETDPRGDWVATLPLETLLERIVRPPDRPVLIKIDVEGFEPQVLAGLDFDGPFRPKNILMEIDRQLAAAAWKSLEALQTFFAARDYDVSDVLGRPLRDLDAVPEANIWARDRKVGLRS